MFTDIGVNLMSPAFAKDRDFVIERAIAAGVTTLIITGSSIESSMEAVAFANAFAEARAAANAVCRTTAGVHPHNAKDWNAEAQERLKELLAEASALERLRGVFATPSPAAPVAAATIAAVGECGLDYNRNFSPPDSQRKCFEDQLALASELKKPVFLHERDAFDDFFSILKKYRKDLPGAVVHCFTGEMKELEAYLALDCCIGITGWVCDERRGGHLLSLLRHIPSDRLLLETDAPYLLPRNLGFQGSRPKSVKGKSGRNEPCFLPHIATFIAETLGKTPEQIAAETTANAGRLFDLPAIIRQ